MEKEESTEKGPVGSPAPENVKKEEDDNINIPTKKDLPDDQMVGTTNDTHKESLEKKHEEHQDTEPSTTKHLLDNEVDKTTDDDQKIETCSNAANDMEIRGQEENMPTDNTTSSSSVQPSNSENSINEKDNSVNDTKINSTERDIDIKGQEEDHTIKNSLLNSESSIDTLTNEPDIQKEDEQKDNLVKDTTINSTVSEINITGQEEDNSTNNNLSKSDNSINTLNGEKDIQKVDQEKDNSVNDTTINPTVSDIDITSREADNSTNNKLSKSDNSINTPNGEPDIQKVDQEKDNSVNDTTINSNASDIDIRSQEQNHSTNNNNSINPLKQDIQKEEQPKDNSTNDTTLNSIANEGEILDCVKDKEDHEHEHEHTSETVKVNHPSTENMEMETHNVQEESKDVSHATSAEDGNESNNHESITKNSLSKKTDTKDNTCSKKEEALVVYGTQEANNSASVLTKFVKLKSLYGVSNVFRRNSKKTDVQNDSNEKNDTDTKNNNIKEVNSEETENQKVNDEGNKKDPSVESMEPIAMKGRVVLYTKLWCKDCKETRLFLRKKRLRYSEINVDVYPGRKLELEKMTGSSDVPRVFFNQVPIGGLKELKALDESGKLQEKIECVISQGPSPKGPLPPFSGEDDVSSRGSVDELAVIVRKMKETIVVKDRFYKFRRVTNCFLGSEAVDFLSEDQFLEREEAVEFARKLAKELFFRHVLEENTFEDGNHLYRFLDQDPVISQCQNIPRGIIQIKTQPLVELSHRLRFLLYAILEAYISEDGRHVPYRTIHGSEEFARFLRIAEELQRVDLNKTSKEEKLAFFINLYNLMAIHAILVWGHPQGALDRRKLFNEFKYVIGGCAYSLSDIYNGILRANQRPPYTLVKPFGIYDKRFKVSLPYPEPLVHFALVSGSRSSPALRCYSPENIDVELFQAARDFLESGAFVLQLDSMTISVTKMLKWYSVDFGKNEVEVLKHAANYLEIEKTRTLLELLNNSQLKVVYQPYDWRLNS
ncbi:hypothetical protein L1887_20994 [Cichorium endivia]|nr:hypothetical protein L1887_20994 [Cichorium endivia]